MKHPTLISTVLSGAPTRCSTVRSAACHALLLLLFTACGFPRPVDVGDDGGPGDAPVPGVTVHVSPSGDDGNDGLTQPVRTLKHAIGLAGADPRITRILLASGSYSMSSGETFPYTVPANVTIAGPAGGGAILTGDKTVPALLLHDGELQDLEFEDFSIAVDAAGVASLTNLRVRGTALAVRAQTNARLVVDTLDITGDAGGCATGIALAGDADLKASNLTARGLGTTLDSEDQSTSGLSNVNITGDRACPGAVLRVGTVKSFSISQGLLDGGNTGIDLGPIAANMRTQGVITNVTILHMKSNALGVGRASVEVIGSEFSHNDMASEVIGVFDAALSLTSVTVDQNFGALALFAQETILTMRKCNFVGNGGGLDINVVADSTATDLGTATSSGENTFLNSTGTEIVIEGADFSPLREINAIGNVWRPNVQNADPTGRYDPALVILGSDGVVSGGNYSLMSKMVSLRL